MTADSTERAARREVLSTKRVVARTDRSNVAANQVSRFVAPRDDRCQLNRSNYPIPYWRLTRPRTVRVKGSSNRRGHGRSGLRGMNHQSLDTSISLLQRLRREQFDESAWSEFVDRYGRLILKWVRRWGANETESRDATQEVLLHLVRQMRDFEYDESRSFRSWLKTVTHRTWAHLRAKNGRCNAPGGSWMDAILESLPAREDLQLAMERQAERELLDLAIQRVRTRVQPRTWRAFECVTLECQSGEDVSRQLGMPLSSVYVARHNVYKMLREELGQLLRE